MIRPVTSQLFVKDEVIFVHVFYAWNIKKKFKGDTICKHK